MGTSPSRDTNGVDGDGPSAGGSGAASPLRAVSGSFSVKLRRKLSSISFSSSDGSAASTHCKNPRSANILTSLPSGGDHVVSTPATAASGNSRRSSDDTEAVSSTRVRRLQSQELPKNPTPAEQLSYSCRLAAKMANVPAAFVTAQSGKVMAAHGLTVLAATEISMRLQTELSTRLQTTNSDGLSSVASSGFSAFSAFSESPFPSSRGSSADSEVTPFELIGGSDIKRPGSDTVLGSLHVLDFAARALSPSQQAVLSHVAQQAAAELADSTPLTAAAQGCMNALPSMASRASSLGPHTHSMVEGSDATSPFERTGNAAALQRSKTASSGPRMPPRPRSRSHTQAGEVPQQPSRLSDDLLSPNRSLSQEASLEQQPCPSLKPAVSLGHRAQAGEVFKDVEIGARLGHGSHGIVYHGLWRGQQVAVKVIEVCVASARDEQAREEVPAEVKLALNVDHPNIVRLLQHACRLSRDDCSDGAQRSNSILQATKPHDRLPWPGWEGGEPRLTVERWLLLEYCDKGSLQTACAKGLLCQRHGASSLQPDVRAVLLTALDVARGMASLHARKILHSDLTAANVLLKSHPSDVRGFVAKVSDFGLSRDLGPQSAVNTKTVGTVTYMPPELLMEGRVSPAADVFAFAVVVVGMFTGKRPWQGQTSWQVMQRVAMNRETVPIPASTPRDLAALLEQCMMYTPQQRPSFVEIFSRLQAMVAVLMPSAARRQKI